MVTGLAAPGLVMPGDELQMARALALAERGRGRTSPNPLVGAVVVDRDGVVVGTGYHERAGEPHAEVHALARAGARARGAALFCTLEPCSHTGRTGPCAPQVVHAGVARVVAAVEDPDPRVQGRGFEYLRAHGVEVVVGVGRAGALRLNEAFFTYMQRGRPFVTLKVATSLDGRIAAAPGARTPLTSDRANREIHRHRAEVDAIVVGSETMLADDPLLTARGPYRDRLLTRVLLDTRLRTPPTARIFGTIASGPVLIVTTAEQLGRRGAAADALVRAGATIEVAPRHDLRAVMERLARRGISALVLEGGTAVHRAALRAGLVDRVQIYVAPVTLGARAPRWLEAGELPLAGRHDVAVGQYGPDVRIEAYVHGAR